MSNVSHPKHYNSGKIEVIEAIEDWKLTYHRGNAVKYIARAGKKDPEKEIEDLEKAVWYLNRDLENLRATKEGREPVRPNDMVKRDRDWNPESVGARNALFLMSRLVNTLEGIPESEISLISLEERKMLLKESGAFIDKLRNWVKP